MIDGTVCSRGHALGTLRSEREKASPMPKAGLRGGRLGLRYLFCLEYEEYFVLV